MKPQKNKRKIMFCLGLCLILMLAACEVGERQPSEGSLSQQDEYLQETSRLTVKGEETGRLAALDGGSEAEVREPVLVSNQVLQQEYPNTLVLRGSVDDQRVALTFDDGPDTRFTPQVLDVLDEYDVKATFFLMGSRAKEHREVTRRIHDEGHAIGNHTYWHPHLVEESIARMRWEVNETEKVLEEIVGFRPRLFRAPYGALNRELVEALGETDYTVVGWNVDSVDWKEPGVDEIVNNVLSNTDYGSIILMHSGGHWTMDLSGTVESLHVIIPRLQKEGIEFVTVPELLNLQEWKSPVKKAQGQ